MEKRAFDNKKRYIYALIMAVILFILGFFLTYSVNYFELQRISFLQENVFYDFYKTQAGYILFNDSICNKDHLEKIDSSIDVQGLIVDQLENKLGKEDESIQDKKKYYYLLELSHLSLMKELNNKCNFSYDSILFFYSNQNNFLSKSKEIGRILDYIKNENPDVLIYSFDFLSNDELVKKLKSFYKIDNSITIIVNEKDYLTEIKNADDILNLLN